MRILALLLSLSLLVFVHELGHYFFARLFKTRVTRFYLFFNYKFSILKAKRFNGKWHFKWFNATTPEEWDQYPDNTMFGIGWIPLGGYCDIAGMIDENKDSKDFESTPQPWEYRSKKAWQRLLIISGGVLVNFVVAMILYVAILFSWGEAKLPIQNATMGYDYAHVLKTNGFQDGDIVLAIDDKPVHYSAEVSEYLVIDDASEVTVRRNGKDTTFALPKDIREQILANINNADSQLLVVRYPFVIKDFVAGSLAEKAGMMAGDSLVSLNGVATPTAKEFMTDLASNADKEIVVGFYRGGELMSLSMQLDGSAKMGAYLKAPTEIYTVEIKEYGFFESIPAGISIGIETLVTYVKSLKLIFTKEGVSQLGGFGSIGSLFPEEWNWAVFWNMTAFLSIILAFMNIIPIPGLDGGHVMFTLYEIITRRKPSDKFLEYAQTVGMVILFALLIYANGNDLFRWLSSKF